MDVGIDIVKNNRLKTNNEFLKRVLSPKEQEIFETYQTKIRQREFLAGRWAAKEAIYKCCGFQLAKNEIEIINDEKGKPIILNKQLQGVVISISHEKKHTIAIAIKN